MCYLYIKKKLESGHRFYHILVNNFSSPLFHFAVKNSQGLYIKVTKRRDLLRLPLEYFY